MEYEGPYSGKSVSLSRSSPNADATNCPTAPPSVQLPDICYAQNNAVQLAKDTSSALRVHPVVYVEWGGHEFFPTSGWDFSGASKHGGDGDYHYIALPPVNVGEIKYLMAGDPSALITGFAGYWGYFGGMFNVNPPPQGPPLHRQWQWSPTGDPDPRVYRPDNAPY